MDNGYSCLRHGHLLLESMLERLRRFMEKPTLKLSLQVYQVLKWGDGLFQAEGMNQHRTLENK